MHMTVLTNPLSTTLSVKAVTMLLAKHWIVSTIWLAVYLLHLCFKWQLFFKICIIDLFAEHAHFKKLSFKLYVTRFKLHWLVRFRQRKRQLRAWHKHPVGCQPQNLFSCFRLILNGTINVHGSVQSFPRSLLPRHNNSRILCLLAI